MLRYLDIPLQHISDPLLRSMHRRVSKADTLALLTKLRAALPGLALRTTFIVGFPGETEEQFQELLDFVGEFRFERAGAFAYSREPGTPAAELPDQLPDEVKTERVDRLMRLQQQISLTQNQAMVGRELEILLEGLAINPPQRGYTYAGRSYADAPEIDGQVFLRVPKGIALQPGQFVTARIEQGWEYDLCGEVIP